MWMFEIFVIFSGLMDSVWKLTLWQNSLLKTILRSSLRS